MRIAADSRNSSTVFRSLITKSTFPCLGTSVQMVGIPIYVGITTSIPLVIENRDISVGLRAVVL